MQNSQNNKSKKNFNFIKYSHFNKFNSLIK